MKPILLNLEPKGYSVSAQEELTKYFEYREVDLDLPIEVQLEKVNGIITRLGFKLDKVFLSHVEKLWFVATATTGVNHIDASYMDKVGAEVISLKGEVEFLNRITPTAEHTWGLLLSLIRNYKPAFQGVELYEWNRERYLGHQLYGKKLGIIGLGRLGKMVANYGQAFGMVILFNDIEDKETDYHQVSLEYLLTQCDVISVHVPLSDETERLLSYDELSLVKSTVFIINTARGEIIDEEALLHYLKCNKISGAALDVLAGEVDWGTSPPIDTPLIGYAKDNSNLIITPHIGGACPDAMRMTEKFIANKICSYYLNEFCK